MTSKIDQLINELTSQGRIEEAYSVLTSHVAQNPEDPDAQFKLGSFCYSQGRFAEAERSLKLANSGTNPAESFYLLGLVLLKLGRPKDAVGAFREACDLKEDFALGHLHWGLALLATNSLVGALGQFKQAAKQDGKLTAAFYQAGIASYKLGNFAESEELFKQACELDPQLAEAFNGLGAAQAALGKFEDALKSFNQSGELDASQPLLKSSMAEILMRMGKVEEASRQYQEIVGLPSQALDARFRSMVYNDWGVYLFHHGFLEEAADKLFQAVSIDPNPAQPRLNLGLVRLSLNEYEQSAEDFAKALELDPALVVSFLYLGSSLFLQGRYEEALTQLRIGTERGLSGLQLQLWQGYCYLMLKQFDQAEQSFRRALVEAPEVPLALDALGASLAFQDRHQEAVEQFKRCLALDKDYALAHLHLARSYEASGNSSGALGEYQAAAGKDPSCLLPEKETIDYLLEHARYDLVQSKSMRLLTLIPGDEDVQLSLARAFRGQQRPDDALKVLEKLLLANPDCGQAFVLQGQIYLGQGLLVDADEKFRTASEMYDGDVALFYAWAKTLGLLGLHELALEKFAKANEIDPFDADIYEAWGATLKVLGRYQEAAEIYRKAAEYI